MAEAAADPRDATYYANEAAAEHIKGRIEGEDKYGRENAESQYGYGESQVAKARPLALRADINKANTEGLLQSGQEAQRRGQVLTGFLGKEHALGETRRNAVEGFNRKDATARESFTDAMATQLAAAQERAKANLVANPPAEPPAPLGVAPTNPATPVNAGGTVTVAGGTRTEKLPGGGFVRTGAPAVRRAAARKVANPNVTTRRFVG